MQHLADTARGRHIGSAFRQRKRDREQEARHNRHAARQERTQQIQPDDAFHVGLLTLFVVGQRAHDQKQDQQRRDRLQRADKQIAQQGERRQLRRGHPEEDADRQAADNPFDQADVIPFFEYFFHISPRSIFLVF